VGWGRTDLKEGRGETGTVSGGARDSRGKGSFLVEMEGNPRV